MTRTIALLTTAALTLAFSNSIQAATWVGPSPSDGSLGGVWNVNSNWTSPATAPNAAGAAAIFNTTPLLTSGNRAYTYGADITIGSLTVTNNSTFTNIWSVVGTTSPFLTFDSGAVGVPATVTITGTNGGTATSNIIRGKIVLNSDLVVDVTKGGTTSAAGEFSLQQGEISGPGGITKNGTGYLTFADAGTRSFTGPLTVNAGRMRLNGAAAANFNGTSGVTVNSGGQLVPDGAGNWGFGPGTFGTPSTFTSPITLNGFGMPAGNPIGNFPGAIRTGSGQLSLLHNPVVLASDTSIDVVSTNPVTAQGRLQFLNVISGPGKLIANQRAGIISREGFLDFFEDNTYSGGTIVEQGTLSVLGTLSTAADLGSGNVMVDGAVVNPPDAAFDTYGKLVIGTGITDAIKDTAYLNITGGGTAGVADRGYVELQDSVNETVGGLMLGGVVMLAGTYGATGSGATNISDEYFKAPVSGTPGIITVVPSGVPGDYNDNGTVDAADYILWRNGGPLARDFTPGVDAGDHTFWRSKFGNTSYAGAGGDALSAGNVPEPSAFALVGLLVAGLGMFSRRDRLASAH